MMNDKREDALVIGQVLAGNPEAFRTLVERYQGLVFRTAYGMAGNKEAAQDATQEIFLRVYRRLQQFDTKQTFGAWIKRITVNYMLDEWKKRQIMTDSMHDEEGAEIDYADQTADPFQALCESEQEALLWQAIESLPEKYRTVIVLRHLEEMRYEEIADKLGIPIGTVTTNIHRARNLLTQRLQAQKSTPPQQEAVTREVES